MTDDLHHYKCGIERKIQKTDIDKKDAASQTDPANDPSELTETFRPRSNIESIG